MAIPVVMFLQDGPRFGYPVLDCVTNRVDRDTSFCGITEEILFW